MIRGAARLEPHATSPACKAAFVGSQGTMPLRSRRGFRTGPRNLGHQTKNGPLTVIC